MAEESLDEISEAAKVLTTKVEDLDRHLTVSQEQIRQTRSVARVQAGLSIFTVLIVGALTIIVVLIVDQSHRDKDLSQRNARFIVCLQTWAQKSADRQQLLATFSTERSNALDKVVRAIKPAQNDPAVFNKALSAYLTASDAYNEAVKTNPIPASPTLNCQS